MRLVHLARASSERGIARSGLRGQKWVFDVEGKHEEIDHGVFAMPLLADWSLTYQWLRELRRWHDERMIAVHVRVRDDEQVLVGRYGARHRRVTASAAARRVLEEPAGAQIIVPRSIKRSEVIAIRQTPQLVGWTQTPEGAHQSACVCWRCLPRGTPDRRRRLRASFARHFSVLKRSSDPGARRDALFELERTFQAGRDTRGFRLDIAPLERLSRHADADVRESVARIFYFYPLRVAEPLLTRLVADEDSGVRGTASTVLVYRVGPVRAAKIGDGRAEMIEAVLDKLESSEPTPELVELLGRMGPGIRSQEVLRAWLEDSVPPSLRRAIEGMVTE